MEGIKPKYDLGSKGRTKTLPPNIDKRQSHYAQQLSKHPDIVEEVKQQVREKDIADVNVQDFKIL